MHKELEVQFLDINKDEMREKLRAAGAELVQAELLMKRVIFDVGPHQFARVRDEGDKIVMTYKNVQDDNAIDGTDEINVVVDNYDNAVALLTRSGLPVKAHQETLRETWRLGEAEIVIDTWPWIPTFIEIEAPSEELVWETAVKLGFDKKDAHFGSVDTKYQHYYGVEPDVVNLHTPEISFDIDPPEWARQKR